MTSRVVEVEASSPPITAIASGAVCAAPNAIGIMPLIMTMLVIRIGRRREREASTAASTDVLPWRR